MWAGSSESYSTPQLPPLGAPPRKGFRVRILPAGRNSREGEGSPVQAAGWGLGHCYSRDSEEVVSLRLRRPVHLLQGHMPNKRAGLSWTHSARAAVRVLGRMLGLGRGKMGS